MPARATHIDLEPTVGGRLQIDIEEDAVRFVVTGRYLELDRPRRLSFTWSCSTWNNPNLESVVTVTLEPRAGNKTFMTIYHAVLPPEVVDQHRTGWSRIAEQLGVELTVGT